MKTRTDVLNHLVQKYNLHMYLEIGVQNPDQNYYRITGVWKVGVDPDPKANAIYRMTSDEFFKINEEKRFDIIFIDGLHTAEQVKKDFENSLKILSPNGFIVLHDCNPLKEEHTIVPRPTVTGHWNGDVYKFATMLSGTPSYRTVDVDNGCGVFRNCPVIYNNYIPTWQEFDRDREELLNLISWDEFVAL